MFQVRAVKLLDKKKLTKNSIATVDGSEILHQLNKKVVYPIVYQEFR